MAGDGTVCKVDYWLNPWLGKGPSMPQAKRDQLWKARNQIAYTKLGLSPTSRKGDDVHVQNYNDNLVDYPRSLAKLLTQVGGGKWEAAGWRYKTDFGLGGALFKVGTALEIWQGKAAVTAADLVTAIKAAGQDLSKLPVFKDFQYVKDMLKAAAKAAKPAPGKAPVPPKAPPIIDGKAMKVTDIKATDIAAVQKLLKSDWEKADLNWKKWAPVP